MRCTGNRGTLEDAGADVGEVAYHFYEAASLGDAATALQWAQRAAEDAMARAGYELAVYWYERAIEIEETARPSDPGRRGTVRRIRTGATAGLLRRQE